MEPEFITFRTFSDEVLANELGEHLDKHHIPYLIEEEPQLFNGSSIFNGTLSKKIVVKIAPNKFEQTNKILADDENNIDINDVEKDYYLFDFTDDELLDLLSKADEWGPFDIALAKKNTCGKGQKHK